ncbi:MAG: hypothetical protein Udaeo_13400 [Candidatus Udaeobacter sp.]|nr:MAG: hypothetical protein Udaeo_13400 [Candidatus Udaeobacter sp.]
MFGADIRVIQRLGLFASKCQHFFDARRVWDVSYHLCLRSGTDLFLHFHPHRLQIEPHLLQDVHCNALAELDQPQKQVLGAHVVVVEPVGFLASKRQNLLSSRCEIIH